MVEIVQENLNNVEKNRTRFKIGPPAQTEDLFGRLTKFIPLNAPHLQTLRVSTKSFPWHSFHQQQFLCLLK